MVGQRHRAQARLIGIVVQGDAEARIQQAPCHAQLAHTAHAGPAHGGGHFKARVLHRVAQHQRIGARAPVDGVHQRIARKQLVGVQVHELVIAISAVQHIGTTAPLNGVAPRAAKNVVHPVACRTGVDGVASPRAQHHIRAGGGTGAATRSQREVALLDAALLGEQRASRCKSPQVARDRQLDRARHIQRHGKALGAAGHADGGQGRWRGVGHQRHQLRHAQRAQVVISGALRPAGLVRKPQALGQLAVGDLGLRRHIAQLLQVLRVGQQVGAALVHGQQGRLGRLQRMRALQNGRPVARIHIGAHMAVQGGHGALDQIGRVGGVTRGAEQLGNGRLLHGRGGRCKKKPN